MKQMPGGQPALLKTRREMRHEDAVALWFHPMSCCWAIAEAAWRALMCVLSCVLIFRNSLSLHRLSRVCNPRDSSVDLLP